MIYVAFLITLLIGWASGILVGIVLERDRDVSNAHREWMDASCDWFEDLEDPEGEWKGELYD